MTQYSDTARDKFCKIFKHFPTQTDSALRILERSGYLHYEVNPDTKARLMFNLGRNDLYRLEESTPQEEAVITELLRNYGGLFTDYMYIEEAMIAHQTGLTTHQVYVILKNLSRRNIISFIPQRKTPIITYLRDRVDAERIIIPCEVYEVRKEQYINRIKAMQQYAQSTEVCRSRLLLDYFGEERNNDCKQCDVCLSHTKEDDKDEKEFIRQQLLTFLADGQKHPITEIRQLNDDWDLVQQVMREMVLEEEILMDGSFLLLP